MMNKKQIPYLFIILHSAFIIQTNADR